MEISFLKQKVFGVFISVVTVVRYYLEVCNKLLYMYGYDISFFDDTSVEILRQHCLEGICWSLIFMRELFWNTNVGADIRFAIKYIDICRVKCFGILMWAQISGL